MSHMEGVQHLQIPLEEIKLATNSFSKENLIARGGFGNVYIGKLNISGEEITVAVKRLDSQFGQGNREFLMEIQMLSCYKHKNLVCLVGFCDESGENILVYEHVKHGSLDRYLSNKDLSWVQRLKISLGAAQGFSYLHNDVGPQHRVLHRDIKSSNILLNDTLEARISDFGLSKISPSNVEFTFLVTGPCGTYGYIDPQYERTGILTKESDVYSFGIVLFEILCGRLAHITQYQDERRFLAPLARQHYEDGKLHDIIYPCLIKQIDADSLDVFSMVAYTCLKENRNERPTMDWIVNTLEKALELQYTSKVAGVIRVGTWGKRSKDPQNHWSFELEKHRKLVKRTVDPSAIRVGTWGKTQRAGPQNVWIFQLEKNHHLEKITVEHGDLIYSLMFTTIYKGVTSTYEKAGGWNGGDMVSEITLDRYEEINAINGTVASSRGPYAGHIIISSLSFVTNKKTHGPFGHARGTPFTVPWADGSFAGFYGLCGYYLDSIGVLLKTRHY